MRHGWLRTGDRVVLEADGSYRFLWRGPRKVIKPGVDNVSAPEIERILYEHVAVTDAAVVGVRNAAGDESIVAFIVLRDDDDDVTADEILLWVWRAARRRQGAPLCPADRQPAAERSGQSAHA